MSLFGKWDLSFRKKGVRFGKLFYNAVAFYVNNTEHAMRQKSERLLHLGVTLQSKLEDFKCRLDKLVVNY